MRTFYAFLSLQFIAIFAGLATPVASQPVPSKAAPTASPLATPLPPHKEIWLSAGLGPYALTQGDAAKNLLSGLEFALANEIYTTTGQIVRFHMPTTGGDACNMPAPPTPHQSTVAAATPTPAPDKGILELTYGRTEQIDDNYFIAEHFSQQVAVGAAILDCTRHVLGFYPPLPAPGSGITYAPKWETFSNQDNSFSLVGLGGAATILNANNSDKTAAAIVTFIGGAKSVNIPAYHKDSKVAAVFQDAVFGEASFVLRCMDTTVRQAYFGIDPNNNTDFTPLENESGCPPAPSFKDVPLP